jgi:rfaE bifunctional protein kinase chain/domain
MNSHKKITTLAELKGLDDNFSICHGHFNLIHPGHLRYLQYAKKLSKKLVVAIRSDGDLSKDLFGEHYNEMERANGVANIESVDHVIILNQSTLRELVTSLGDSKLILGREFKSQQPEYISSAIHVLEEYKGLVIFHAGETSYASTNFLHTNVLNLEKSRKDSFKEVCDHLNITLKSLKERISAFSSARLLVIGDTIVDNYVACDAIGMSAEAPVLVVKELENVEFIGGAAIVASHVRALGSYCHYISVVGDDAQANMTSKVLKDRDIDHTLITDSTRPTTYKTRYMVENQKLFRVSRIKEHLVSEEIEFKIIEKIKKLVPKIDGIMISDFVYGVITPNILNSIIILAKKYNLKLFGDLQCSSQIGNVAKFNGFDLITPTEKESRISLNDNENGIEWIANTLLKHTNSKKMLLKLGSEGFIAYDNETPPKRQNFPALTANPVDVSGAGDSLFSAMSISLVSDSKLMEAAAIGACMASLAVKEVGNVPISREKLVNYIEDLLS